MLGSIRARESLSFFRYGNFLAHPSVWDEMSRPDRVRRQRSHAIITGVKYRSCGIYPRGDIPSSSFLNVNASLRALAQSRLLSHCFGNRRRFSVYFRRVKPEVGLQEREAVNRAGIPKRGGEGRGGTAIRGRIIRVYAGWFIHINVSHCRVRAEMYPRKTKRRGNRGRSLRANADRGLSAIRP